MPNVEKTVLVSQKVEDLCGLYMDLRRAGFKVRNVGADVRGTYVHMEVDEDKDPAPLVKAWAGKPAPKLPNMLKEARLKELAKVKEDEALRQAESIENERKREEVRIKAESQVQTGQKIAEPVNSEELAPESMKYTLEHSKHGSDIHQHLVTLHNLVTSISAKAVIELGVNTGESTIALLEAVAATNGKLISVDQHDFSQTRLMLEKYGLTGRWEFHKMDDIKFGTEIWPKDKKADIVFVDTSHQYEHTKKEIDVFDQILRPGGIMIFHDTVSHYDGVQKPINEFLKTHKAYKYENKTNCNGLGILRKPA